MRSFQESEYIMTPVYRDTLNLAVGQPGKDLIPTDKLNAALRFAAGSCIDPLMYQYPSVGGPFSMRRDLAKLLVSSSRYPKSLSPEDIRITYGNSQGLTTAIKGLTRPGDAVIVEDPTYFLSAKFFAECYVKVHRCPASRGLDIVEFEKMVHEIKPKLVYVNPIHHNPTGTCLSVAARTRLLELSVDPGFIILSDEPYVLLSFNDEVIEEETSLATTAERVMPASYNRLVCFGSFSKIIAPGLRCGWMSGHESILRLVCTSGALVSGGSPAPILVEAIHHFIVTGSLRQHVNFLRQELKIRKDALIKNLQDYLGEHISFHAPTGGYFAYVYFRWIPDMELFNHTILASENFKLLPGPSCSTSAKSADAHMKSCARLAFSFYTPHEIKEAVEILSDCHSRVFEQFSDSSDPREPSFDGYPCVYDEYSAPPRKRGRYDADGRYCEYAETDSDDQFSP